MAGAETPVAPARGEVDDEDDEPSGGSPTPVRWFLPAALFVATVASVWYTGAAYEASGRGLEEPLDALVHGWRYAVPLLAILLCHEFGHYVAARLHGVDASLPFFIPAPLISAFGTMGAVIRMRGRIRSRDALLDIGAAGPLAGLAVALPVLVVGLATSKVERSTGFVIQEGQSLLYLALKRAVIGPMPEGWDVQLNAVAFAGWVGLFVTALNLLPIGQLDGGHIAYALLGPRQNRVSRAAHLGLLGIFLLNVWWFVAPVVRGGLSGDHLVMGIGNSVFWLFWFVLLMGVRRASGGGDHPPTDAGPLSPTRRVIAVLSLVFFVLLFMPTPWSTRLVPE
jgi:membrane-associated protease RseP (regulator of RpoE activity)